MANKPEKTLEQLKAEAELANQAYRVALQAEEQKKKEEAERKKAELALQKEKRKKEANDAIKNAVNLVQEYIEDYGSFSITDDINDLSFLGNLGLLRWFL